MPLEVARISADAQIVKARVMDEDRVITSVAVAGKFARMELAEALYKARREAGLTPKELADRMGTRQTYIAALERGRKNITFSTPVIAPPMRRLMRQRRRVTIRSRRA